MIGEFPSCHDVIISEGPNRKFQKLFRNPSICSASKKMFFSPLLWWWDIVLSAICFDVFVCIGIWSSVCVCVRRCTCTFSPVANHLVSSDVCRSVSCDSSFAVLSRARSFSQLRVLEAILHTSGVGHTEGECCFAEIVWQVSFVVNFAPFCWMYVLKVL